MMMQYIDKLTGLYVQHYFEKRMDEELARTLRYKRPLTILMFEINYNYFMPDFNIRWAMVYTVLKQFGSVLLKQLRNVDLAGRYGGDQFMVLLPETPVDGGMIAADRIRKHVEEHTFIGDNVLKNIHIAIDGGMATCPIHGKTRQELVSSAHQGLLIARNRGGNKIIPCPHELYDQEGNSLLIQEQEEHQESASDKTPETPVEPEPEKAGKKDS